MKRAIISVLYLLICGVAQAEEYTLLPEVDEVVSKNFPGWKISASGEPGVFLIHPGSIVRNGDIVDVWELASYFAPKTNVNGYTYQSEKSLNRFDCKKRTVQFISVNRYADSNARGELVHTYRNNNPQTIYIVPDSIGEMMMLASCEKNIVKKTPSK